MERHVAEKRNVDSVKEHKSLSVKQCDVFLYETCPFTGVSPDCVGKYDCQEDSCLEIQYVIKSILILMLHFYI